MTAPQPFDQPGAPPPQPAGDESLADGEWHRLHPLTPLLKGGLVLIIVAGLVLNNFRDRLIFWFVNLIAPDEVHPEEFSGGDPVDWVLANNLILVALLVVLGVLVVLIVGFWLVWRFHEFRITGDDVEVRKGIVFRSNRRAPLDRVQGVNLTRPFPARLIGLAKLEVVGAGTDANVPLEYLSTAKAESVRADILRLASGARAARAARRGEGVPAAGSRTQQLTGAVSEGVTGIFAGVDMNDVAPESVVKIPTGRLIGSQAIVGALWLVFFAVLFGIAMGVTIPAILAGDGPGSTIAVLGLVLGVGIPMVIAAVAITWAQISRSLRYSIAPTNDGIRITFGLLTTVTETIPPGRIFAVEVSQSLLWRPFGWWTIKINRMSGKSAAQQQSSTAQQFNIVLPVGTREDVERVIGLILPDLPAQDRTLLWEHGMLGPQPDDPFQKMEKRAWWRRPVSWRRHGFTVTDFGLVMRRGVFWRKLAVFPLARLQGVSAQQGPVDRWQRVAWMKAHSVTGPILGEVVGFESSVLMDAVDDIARRAAEAAYSDPGHRWAEVVAEYAPAAVPAEQSAEAATQLAPTPADAGSAAPAPPADPAPEEPHGA